MHTTNPTRSVTRTGPEVSRLKDALRYMKSNVTKPQRDPRVRHIEKGIERDQFKAPEHLLAMGYNALERGAPLENVLQLGETFNALMRQRWAELHGGDDLAGVTLAELHQAEEEAQGEKEAAETRYMHDRSAQNASRLLAADARYLLANDRLRRCIQRAALS